ncbi:MAG TPA: cation:dicarboxylase symporter family transporter, partial [Gammaproteobacteria bacterium]|nr:cation:dicarboxylase symporter family transporter [Gammaproteobacteria bacterium]
MSAKGQHHFLLFAILVGAIAGIICGWFFGNAMQSVAWLGNLFLDALKMTIVPLIVAAVISGVTSLGDVRNLGRMGILTVLFYASTTAVAVLIGLILVNIIQPGAGYSGEIPPLQQDIAQREVSGITDIIQSLINPNLVAAAAEFDLKAIIVFCLLFGIALTTIGNRGKTLIDFFNGLNEVMMKIVIWIMYFAPVGIFALIAARLGEAGGGAAIWQEIKLVGMYIATVILGLGLHFLFL